MTRLVFLVTGRGTESIVLLFHRVIGGGVAARIVIQVGADKHLLLAELNLGAFVETFFLGFLRKHFTGDQFLAHLLAQFFGVRSVLRLGIRNQGIRTRLG